MKVSLTSIEVIFFLAFYVTFGDLVAESHADQLRHVVHLAFLWNEIVISQRVGPDCQVLQMYSRLIEVVNLDNTRV